MTRIILRRARARDVAWMSDPEAYHRTLTPQAAAGVKRSARARQARHQRTWGLLAPVVPGPPPVETVEERIEIFNARVAETIKQRRSRTAADWIRVRRRLRELPADRAAELVDEWNARTAGGAWPIDLLVFLDERAPTAERIAERRAARVASARNHRRVAEEHQSWWVRHTNCPEGEAGVARINDMPFRQLRCIGCEAEWTRETLPAALADGTLRIVDCRLQQRLFP